jgi:transketolase
MTTTRERPSDSTIAPAGASGDGQAPAIDRSEPALWRELAAQLRVDSIRCSSKAASGHPTSSMSAADLMAVLVARHYRYDPARPRDANNDHLVFSKGHASPLLYSMFKAMGLIGDEEFLTYRSLGSRLEGHPVPILPWVEVATGSLGQGLPIGVGMAIAARHLDRLPTRTWVLCGDSEMAEGSMDEALEHAGHLGLENLIAIVDVNRLGQTGETMHGWDLDAYRDRAEVFGWRSLEVDGHDPEAIDRAYTEAASFEGRPTMIVARTIKGYGVREVADKEGWHGKPLPNPEQAIKELGGERHLIVPPLLPERRAEPHRFPNGTLELPRYELGKEIATRQAYGEALAALGTARGDVIALDGEVSNSTFAELFRDAHPERYFEMYIAEQQMVAAAVGIQVRGWVPFASTFAAFLTRAYDFIRMGAISRADVRLAGSHAGVSIGEDGPSQMALEDLAMMRAVFGSTVLYPCDGNQTARLVERMANTKGISYMRTTRGKTAVVYGPDETFEVGGSKVLRSSDDDRVAVVTAGITVHEALKAADSLAAEGIAVRVIDAYSVKPIDAATLAAAARDTGGRLIVVEDHFPEGGLGAAVLDAFADADERPRVVKLAVTEMPGSAKPAELLAAAGLDAAHIAAAVRRLAGARAQVSSPA